MSAGPRCERSRAYGRGEPNCRTGNILTFLWIPKVNWTASSWSVSFASGMIPMSISTNDEVEALRRRLAHRHHCVGWLGLLVFLSLGVLLEGLHGFKIGLYLDPGNRIRREMWTL